MKKNKGENGFFNNFLKVFIIILGLSLQFVLILFLFGATATVNEYASIIFDVIKLAFVLYIIYKPINNAYKIIWIFLILFVPALGISSYLLWGNNRISSKVKKKIKRERVRIVKDDITGNIDDISRRKEAVYLKNVTGFPTYSCDSVSYFSTGEDFYSRLKSDLLNAKKYILIEFFIVSDGAMWNEIYEILKQKRKEHVDVYFIYDSLGSMFKKPRNLKKMLLDINVKVLAFNPFTPFIRSYINYRDHRKIIVVDGCVAYTGGINIGDEYINLSSRLGYWKDCGVRVTGEAVKSFVSIFFSLWNLNNRRKNYNKFLEDISGSNGYGFIVPYSDNALNKKNPSEHTYINIINNASKYVYIFTPYLILDSEVEGALINASLSGVDVRIITPFVPDKKLVNACTKSFYGKLLESGVKIYEFSPGFVHSKVILSDDVVANVGTVNFDFRSFYLNYECGVWMYNTGEELKIKKDFLSTLSKCSEVKLDVWRSRGIEVKILEAILRVISPLL